MKEQLLEQLLKALEAGAYDARPSKLRQGCLTLFVREGDTTRLGTPEEYEQFYCRDAAQRKVQKGPITIADLVKFLVSDEFPEDMARQEVRNMVDSGALVLKDWKLYTER